MLQNVTEEKDIQLISVKIIKRDHPPIMHHLPDPSARAHQGVTSKSFGRKGPYCTRRRKEEKKNVEATWSFGLWEKGNERYIVL